MKKQEIATSISKKHREFTTMIDKLSDEDFMFSYIGKWTAAQQLDHIYKSVTPLIRVLRGPKLFMKLSFGTSNRPSKDYEGLVKKYLLKLEAGGKAPAMFVPPVIKISRRKALIKDLLGSVEVLTKQVNKFTEQELDEYILPHPLLGKLTLREMFYFTLYHVEHHQNIAVRNLKERK